MGSFVVAAAECSVLVLQELASVALKALSPLDADAPLWEQQPRRTVLTRWLPFLRECYCVWNLSFDQQRSLDAIISDRYFVMKSLQKGFSFLRCCIFRRRKNELNRTSPTKSFDESRLRLDPYPVKIIGG